MNNIIVQKFGGASLATIAHIKKVCDIIAFRKNQGVSLCVVVSAMGDTTDDFTNLAYQLSSTPNKRELDALISCGENISASLLTIYLQALGIPAMSFNARQAGIFTNSDYGNAQVLAVYDNFLNECLMRQQIAVVAGFQGYNEIGDIVTLGRGGSDLTAVVLGVAVKARHVEFFKDVNGIYDVDPHIHLEAKHFPYLDYCSALDIVNQNAHQVIYAPAISYAQANLLTLRVVGIDCFDDEKQGTYIGLHHHNVYQAA